MSWTTMFTSLLSLFASGGIDPKPLPTDCLDVMQSGQTRSGVYSIQLAMPEAENKRMDVFCDMETDGGGWTVIQRRDNYTKQENFDRKWNDYKEGFGNIKKDFWIGNDNIYYLSNVGDSEIRVDMRNQDSESKYIQFSNFKIDGESEKYKMHVSGHSGTAGDDFKWTDGQLFSTPDTAGESRGSTNGNPTCEAEAPSGWWFTGLGVYPPCGLCNFNSVYSTQPRRCNNPMAEDAYRYIHYHSWRKCEPLRFTEMKIRRK